MRILSTLSIIALLYLIINVSLAASDTESRLCVASFSEAHRREYIDSLVNDLSPVSWYAICQEDIELLRMVRTLTIFNQLIHDETTSTAQRTTLAPYVILLKQQLADYLVKHYAGLRSFCGGGFTYSNGTCCPPLGNGYFRNIDVSGTATIGSITVDNIRTEDLTVTNSITVYGDVGVGGNETIAGDLIVSGSVFALLGNSYFRNIDVSGTATIGSIAANTMLVEDLTVTNSVTVYGNVGVGGNETIEGDLIVRGSVFAPSVKITVFNTSGTWTKDPRTQTVTIYAIAGGSGGGSGRQGASGAAGGGSGGPIRSFATTTLPASFLADTEIVTIGLGGAGGVAQAVANTDGNAGGAGQATTIGVIGAAASLGGGAAGTSTNTLGLTSLYGINISNGPSFTTTNSAGRAGGGNTTAGGTGQAVSILVTPSSGGGGSGANSATPQQGGAGGDIMGAIVTILAGGAGGIATGTINGHDGNDATSLLTGGTGGGGGGGQSGGTVAGKGGNGGFPGGGGGGGGGSLNGTSSGAGGNGAAGQLVIIEYF